MSSIALKFAQRRVAVVEEVVDQLQIECDEAEFGWAIQELVAETTEMSESIWRVIAPYRQGIQPDTEPEKIASAQTVAHLLNKVIALFARVRQLIKDVQRRGDSVDGIERFGKAEAEITLIRKDFFSRWPMPDDARVKTAKQELAAGKFRVL